MTNQTYLATPCPINDLLSHLNGLQLYVIMTHGTPRPGELEPGDTVPVTFMSEPEWDGNVWESENAFLYVGVYRPVEQGSGPTLGYTVVRKNGSVIIAEPIKPYIKAAEVRAHLIARYPLGPERGRIEEYIEAAEEEGNGYATWIDARYRGDLDLIAQDFAEYISVEGA